MGKIIVEIPDEEAVWINVRDKRERMKAWERRGLYQVFDGAEGGVTTKELFLTRHMAAHLIRDWSLDTPKPSVTYKDGTIMYENIASYDELDADVEKAILVEAAAWVKQIALNFQPTQDPKSPTEPSDG